MLNSFPEILKIIIESFLSVFYISQENSLEMLNFYLRSSLMVYGKSDTNGVLTVYRNRLTMMHLMAFACLVEIVKEFSFITNICPYDHIFRVIFIDCSVLFSSMRYYYVILHSALSLPYCFIFLYFWSLNLRYFYATKTSVYFYGLRTRLNKVLKNQSVREKSSLFQMNKSGHIGNYYYQEPPEFIVKKFRFRFARFMTIKSITRISKEYQIHSKYLRIKFKILHFFQNIIYSISKIGISSWCLTVIYTSLFYSKQRLNILIYLLISIPVTISHVILFLIGYHFRTSTYEYFH